MPLSFFHAIFVSVEIWQIVNERVFFFTEHAASLCKTYADKSDELQDEFRRQSLRCE